MLPADSSTTRRLTGIIGVRLERAGPVIFADCAGLPLSALDAVLIETSLGASHIATVIIGTGQLIEDEVGIKPTARVLRLATPEDIAASPLPPGPSPLPPGGGGLGRGGNTRTSTVGMPDEWDAWMQPPGAEARLLPESAEPARASDFIRTLFPDPPPPRSSRNRR